MNIIILDHEPFSDRRKKHFFIDHFFSIGWDVQYWCIQNILNYSKNIEYNYRDNESFVSYINSTQDLKKRLEILDVSRTLLFFEFSFNPDTLYIFEKVHKLGLTFTQLSYYRNPVTNFHCAPNKTKEKDKVSFFKNKMKLIKSFLNDSNIRHSILLQKFRSKYFNTIQKSEFCFATGNNHNNLPPSKKYISLDYFDIIEYKNIESENPVVDKPYIVFTDIYLGKHPDLQKNNAEEYIDQQLYWKKLRTFFDKLESQLSMPIVIAAHPKAKYTSEFGRRLYFYNKTANLVSNSEFVITHGSISTSFALLANKKVVHFYTDEFLIHDKLLAIYYNMLNVSEKIGGLCWNIDMNYEVTQIDNITVNSTLYSDILTKYFRKENQNLTNFDLVKNTINDYFSKNG